MDDIFERICSVLADYTDDAVTPGSSFMGDLGLESVEIFDMLVELEVEFGVKIPEKIIHNVETVGDMAEAIKMLLEQ